MICVVDSVIYLLGGYGKYRVVQSSVDAYDTTTGKQGAVVFLLFLKLTIWKWYGVVAYRKAGSQGKARQGRHMKRERAIKAETENC